MKYNFDKIVGRENTASVKYDLRKAVFGDESVIPLWVADMDFETPDFIREAVIRRANHPVYGYTFRTAEFNNSIAAWLKRRHGWNVRSEWISFSPGVVPALNMAVMAYTRPGDRIIVQPPVYFPFFSAVKNHGRELVYNELSEKDGLYVMDLADLEKRIDEKTRMLILCHPHNPVGRLWNRKELEILVDFCAERNILILSDEIHSDLMLNGNKHIPLACISDRAASMTITCIAPSKTFNLAGLSTSAMIIPDETLKKSFDKILEDLHTGMGNLFGAVALEAAYTQGEPWLEELLAYLSGNLSVINEFFLEKIPEVRVIQADATYMVWLDFRKLGLENRELKEFLVHRAGLGLNDGPSFGPGGDGFQRMNFALPRSKLLNALEQLMKAVNSI